MQCKLLTVLLKGYRAPPPTLTRNDSLVVKGYVPASDSSTGVRIKQTIVAVREIRSNGRTQRLFSDSSIPRAKHFLAVLKKCQKSGYAKFDKCCASECILVKSSRSHENRCTRKLRQCALFGQAKCFTPGDLTLVKISQLPRFAFH